METVNMKSHQTRSKLTTVTLKISTLDPQLPATLKTGNLHMLKTAKEKEALKTIITNIGNKWETHLPIKRIDNRLRLLNTENKEVPHWERNHQTQTMIRLNCKPALTREWLSETKTLIKHQFSHFNRFTVLVYMSNTENSVKRESTRSIRRFKLNIKSHMNWLKLLMPSEIEYVLPIGLKSSPINLTKETLLV